MPRAAPWMQPEIIILSEIHQNEKTPHEIICKWNRKCNTKKPIRQKQTHGRGEQTCGCQRGGGWG